MAWSEPQTGMALFRLRTSYFGTTATPLATVETLTSTSTVALDLAVRTLPSGVSRAMRRMRMFGPGLQTFAEPSVPDWNEWTENGDPRSSPRRRHPAVPP